MNPMTEARERPLAALYARVSTPQQEQEATIESQVAAIESYAQAQGYRLSKELYFLDQAISGARLARPALDRLRDLAPEGMFEVVLCLCPDRLARQYAHQWVLMNELQRVGIKVLFVNQPPMGDDPQGQLLLGIQGLFAEYERAMIAERLRRGKLYRIRLGQLIQPVAPYGYRYLPVKQAGGGRWILNETEAEVVRQIFAWYTAEDQPTMQEIVRRLKKQGVRTPPRGRTWFYSAVQAILKQPAYTGQAYYNSTHSCHEVVGRPRKIGHGFRKVNEQELRPREEWIPVEVPTILSQDTWQKAQERLAMNQKFARRHSQKYFYLLRGLLVCDVCGRTLAGRTSGTRVTYYCYGQGKQRTPDTPAHSRVIAAKILEPLVWQAVGDLLHNPTLMADAWQNQAESAQTNPDEMGRLQNRLKSLQKQWQRLLDLYQEGQIEKTELSQRKERLEQQRQTTEQRLQSLMHQKHQMQVKAQMLEDFTTFCQQIESGLSNPTPELQQKVIRLLIDHIIVGENEIVIKHIVPTSDDCRLLPGRN
jgi:site-specific DNA recombinase